MIPAVLLNRRHGPPPIPAATPGQTPYWRAMPSTAATQTVDSTHTGNLTSVAGAAYYYKRGPRVGPDGSEAAKLGGYSLRVPYQYDVPGAADLVFRGSKTIPTGETALRTRGMVTGWFNFRYASIDYSRCLRIYGTNVSVGDTFLGGIRVKRAGEGLAAGLKFSGENTTGNSEIAFGHAQQDLQLAIEWYVPDPVGGTGAKTWTAKVRAKGDASWTVISTFTEANPHPLYATAVVDCGAQNNEVSAVIPWYGAVGGLSIYALADATAGSLPTLDIEPPMGVPVYCIDPVNGDDSRDAYGVAGALKTCNELVLRFNRGLIVGDFRGWQPTNFEGVGTDFVAGRGVATGVQNGTETLPYGDVVEFRGGALLVTRQINTEYVRSVHYRGAAGGSLTGLRSLAAATWTQPSAALYPNVWRVAGTDYVAPVAAYRAGGFAGATLLVSVLPGADLAASLATLNGTADGCFADASYFYVRSATNPNANGVAYRAAVVLPSLGTSSGMIGYCDGLIENLPMEGGPVWQTNGGVVQPAPQYGAGFALNDGFAGIAAQVGCAFSVCSNHQVGAVGDGGTGLRITINCTFTRMPLGGIPLVDYTSSTSATRKIIGVTRGNTETLGVQVPGSAVGVANSGHFYTCHSNGPTNPAFADEFTGNSIEGDIDTGLIYPGELVIA